MRSKFFNFLILSLLVITLNACSSFSREYRTKWLQENVNFLKVSVEDGAIKFPGDGSKCALEKMDVWKLDEVRGNLRWGRDQDWMFENGWSSNEGVVLDFENYQSPTVLKNPEVKLIYLGPWYYVSRIGKEIRFVAQQGIKSGGITYGYESKTEENAKIPSMKKVELARKPHRNIDLCAVEWTAKYGYNAVIDLKLNYPIGIFTGKIMKGSGEIIQADE